ncbi:hypothetical protein RchiOBHm_Chr4g0423271 [Rosa chinensis]|uniref:Uncharacterized protein n=1 Tax=Rosa chinensis TaxID=74649 RepID=A0A2P6QYQ1_ROSCH|nr:hypothetical protein RchiOBHm_Chr4g0423271 [Rosa chinensis]
MPVTFRWKRAWSVRKQEVQAVVQYGSWACYLFLGLFWWAYSMYVFSVVCLLLRCILFSINPYIVIVGRVGLNVHVYTQYALFVLERSRVVIKWTNPSSGKMKPSAASYSSDRQHSGKAGLIALWLCMSFIFPVCHPCEANSVSQISSLSALATRCMFEYIRLVEIPVIIRDALSVLIVFRAAAPLYSTVSLMKP